MYLLYPKVDVISVPVWVNKGILNVCVSVSVKAHNLLLAEILSIAAFVLAKA